MNDLIMRYVLLLLFASTLFQFLIFLIRGWFEGRYVSLHPGKEEHRGAISGVTLAFTGEPAYQASTLDESLSGLALEFKSKLVRLRTRALQANRVLSIGKWVWVGLFFIALIWCGATAPADQSGGFSGFI